ncbi:hypothetical protein [Rhodopirellula sp. MGV]|uniref:hypothetical protein n=1 Tax=Rhodopirellula sp. MGV TaxID=2023130 RepID=UPI000B966DA4|nr:hypothetical protein [Rhodopirellula sp. MGV]OYP35149.1 hypothetical protein CGZ80_12150 [Rhodopirellula sp. MGV]PNY36775.1 hypothetical protein C2E31_11235 [Rhodopirellula baltica]
MDAKQNTYDLERQRRKRSVTLPSDEVLKWIEFGCWVTVLYLPVLRLTNGVSVSPEQFVSRSLLASVSVLGAIFLSLRRIRKRRQLDVERGS